ncbi:MAG: lysylphosphatidylglycerol synthase transmembrane domain-containing protein [Caldilineales bacterium]
MPADPEPSRLRARSSLWRNWRTWAGLGLSLVCLLLALADIHLQTLAVALRSASPVWLLAAAASVLVTGWAKAWRWRLLLYPAAMQPGEAPRVGLARLSSIWLAGTGINLALPVPRAGDLLRVYLAGEAGAPSKSLVLGTIAVEKLLDTLMLAVCLAGLLLLMVLPAELAQRQTSTFVVAAGMALLTALLLWQHQRLIAAAGRLLRHLPRGRSILASLENGVQGLSALRQPRPLLGLALLTLAIWALSAASNVLVFRALALPPSWTASLFLLVVLQVGVSLPSTPGKIFVFQLLCRWALSVFAVGPDLAVAYGILLYLVAPLLLMLVGALALAVEGWRLGRVPHFSAGV